MIRPVTFKIVDNTRRLLGIDWKSEAQRICMEELCESDRCTYQGFRQKGKSFNMGLLGAAYTSCAGTPIVAAPTLGQASLIIFSNIKDNTEQVLELLIGSVKKDPDRATFVKWSHGGGLIALSAANITETGTKKKPPEGWTGNLLIIDEGHRIPPEFAGIFYPMLFDAEREGTAKIVILGVGGHKSSAIEVMKTRGYKQVFMPASKASELDPALIPIFARAKAELSEWEYRQMYECLPVTEGMRPMFVDVPGEIDVQKYRDQNLAPGFWFGIDVGKVKDSTVVKVVERWGDIRNEVDSIELQGVDYVRQGQLIFDFINRYPWLSERVTIELNGPGQALFDILNQWELFGKSGRSINGINTTYDIKYSVWNDVNVAFREGWFGIKPEAARDHYASLLYNVKEDDGKIEFEHSDDWMALVMCWMGMQQAGAF